MKNKKLNSILNRLEFAKRFRENKRKNEKFNSILNRIEFVKLFMEKYEENLPSLEKLYGWSSFEEDVLKPLLEEKEEFLKKQVVEFFGEIFFIQENGHFGSSEDDFVETIVSTIEKNKNSKRLTIELERLLKKELIHYKYLRAIALRLENLGLWEEAYPFYDYMDIFLFKGQEW